ncbi:hypothetical protein G5I_10196 [Acromyrmex echinatior]|uniref:Uncharacterized protein n=1 Tax=Acromyrmex echinatior TaxID=103372 RepID=F4WW42_ACREC|nr:hypothetical protein G5I_10196 [Acromyrmex echinatior]
MKSCEYLSVGDRGIVSQHHCMRKSNSSMRNISSVVTREPTAAATAFGVCDRIQNGLRILYNLDRTKRTSRWILLKDRDAFDVEDEERRRRWKDEVNMGYNHGEEPDSYSNYSSCKEFPAASHPNVHSSRRRSTYVPRREYRCHLIPSAPLPAWKGGCSYYIGKLRSLVDIGDTSTSRKRFSCTGREQNPLVIGITSSLTLCTSDPVCVNGTRRTEKGYKVLGGSQYRTEATMQRGSLKWSLGDPVSTPSPSPTPQALIHYLGR